MTHISIDVDASAERGAATISPHIYGHFSEHLGRCVYDGFWVGEDSPIPNTRGIRNDLVAALRRIGIPNLRWPGGCFADEYHWMDGVGPRDRRPKAINSHWGAVTENNHFGTHEFMDLCNQLECEPYICGNVGSGTVREMQQWVEYLTSDGDDSMAELRRANGREAPWKIRLWGVGNENWGCGGRMRPEHYADEYRRYSTYLRNLSGNQLYLIACGADAGRPGGHYDWTEVLMQRVTDYGSKPQSWPIQGLSLHYYTRPSGDLPRTTATDFEERDWFALLKSALYTEELVSAHAAIMDRFDPDKQVAMIVDEWGTWHDVEPGTHPRFLHQQSALRDALVASVSLDVFNRHCDRVRGAQIAQTINVLQSMALTKGPRMLLTPTYHVFEMYRGHHGATLVPIEIQPAAYRFGDESIPAVSVSASRDAGGRLLVTMSNLDPTDAQEVRCELCRRSFSHVDGRILTAPTMQAHNTFDAPAQVAPAAFDTASLDGATLSLTLPAKSVVALTCSGGDQPAG